MFPYFHQASCVVRVLGVCICNGGSKTAAVISTTGLPYMLTLINKICVLRIPRSFPKKEKIFRFFSQKILFLKLRKEREIELLGLSSSGSNVFGEKRRGIFSIFFFLFCNKFFKSFRKAEKDFLKSQNVLIKVRMCGNPP
jgi:hypothetical protein